MTPLQAGLAALAVYRLAHLVAIDEGPLQLFLILRTAVGQRHWWGRGLHCPLCISFWLAMVPAGYFAATAADFALYWLGLAGAAVLLHRICYK